MADSGAITSTSARTDQDTVSHVGSRPIRVVVVDQHYLFRAQLVRLLRAQGIDVVGEASRGPEAVRLAAELQPEVVIMDIEMAGMSGIEAAHRLGAAAPTVGILILTVLADERSVMRALRAGASGYLLKDARIDQIIEGVQAAARGESFLSPRIAANLVRRLRNPPPRQAALRQAGLTPRELAVLELLAGGLDNAEIAARLQLSSHTVKNHVSSIVNKLEVGNRVQAAVAAVREGLL